MKLATLSALSLLLGTASAEVIRGAVVDVLFRGSEFPLICTLKEPKFAVLHFPTDSFPHGCPLTTRGGAIIDGTVNPDGSITVKTIDKVSTPHTERHSDTTFIVLKNILQLQ